MNDNAKLSEFVTFTAAGQLFGLPIARVQDVFKPIADYARAAGGAEIAGVLNLRGRIVTAIDHAQPARSGISQREDVERSRRWRSASNAARIVRASGRYGR